MEGIMKPTLTKEQEQWVDEQLSRHDVIYAGFHGSYLYGLNTPTSDIDVKAIYLPSKTELLKGNAVKTYNKKNDGLNIEIEIKSLSSFLKSAESCDANCVDLLHSPEGMSYITSNIWKEMCEHKDGMYAKNMKGLIGYIKTHTHKYSNKIQRLEEMTGLLDICGKHYQETLKVEDIVPKVSQEFKYIKPIALVQDYEQQYLEVCGKKYLYSNSLDSLVKAVEQEVTRYGSRSNDGLSRGQDSKSLSHALRVLSQVEELVDTRDIKFPLREKEYLLSVKKGEVELENILSDIDKRFDRVMEKIENSDLRDNVDLTQMYKVLEDYYFN